MCVVLRNFVAMIPLGRVDTPIECAKVTLVAGLSILGLSESSHHG